MPSDPLISRTIGNYTIISRLGRGGMATVYRARQVNMQRDVALKVMSDELADDPQFIQRFEREAQFIAKLEHPRILPVHDFGHEDDVIYLVMRLIEGDSLYDRLLEGPLSLATAARYTNQIAEALDYAHMQGVIHRDLKPNNVLLDELDNVYLMDFGLAKLIASSTHLTQTGAVLGTPQYMAPEQWRGEPVDARTDIYALGVILYEMLVGRTPFESDTPYTLMYKHINDAPPPPREVQPDLPETVSEVILKALAKDRNARYSAAGELARALTTVVQAADIEGADGLVAPPLVVIPESAPEPAAEAEPVQAVEAETGSPAVEAAEFVDAEPAAQVEAAPVQAAPETGKPDVVAEKVVPPPVVPVLAVPEAIKPPPPAMILPPPALVPPKDSPAAPPIPVPLPGRAAIQRKGSPRRARQYQRDYDQGYERKHKSPPDSWTGFVEGVKSSPAVRSMVDVFDQSIDAALSKAAEAAPISDQFDMVPVEDGVVPVNAPAVGHVRSLLSQDEPVTGVLDVRGTVDWGTWKTLIIAGLVLNVIGGMLSAGFLNVLGWLAWIYIGAQGFRTWKGHIGRYYLGFTPERIVLLPRDSEGRVLSHEASGATWPVIERLQLSGRYVFLDMPARDGRTVKFAALVVPQGEGGLGYQYRWLPGSPITALVDEQGFEVRNL